MSRQPCRRCGDPPDPERPFRNCFKCRSELAGKCSRCGGPKPKNPGHGQRLCANCEPVRTPGQHITPCHKCGTTEPKRPGRRLCDECQEIETAATKARARARLTLKRAPCERCGKPKGPGRQIRLCPACRAERAAPRMCRWCNAVPVGKGCRSCEACKRENTRATKRRRWERVLEARQSWTPEQWEEHREVQRRWRRNTANKVVQLPRGKQTIPARPLADAIARRAQVEAAGNLWDDLPQHPRDYNDSRLEVVCGRAGISSRNLREWRSGARVRCQFEVADRALTRLGLAWWEVWPEGTDGHDDAAALFAGEAVAA